MYIAVNRKCVRVQYCVRACGCGRTYVFMVYVLLLLFLLCIRLAYSLFSFILLISSKSFYVIGNILAAKSSTFVIHNFSAFQKYTLTLILVCSFSTSSSAASSWFQYKQTRLSEWARSVEEIRSTTFGIIFSKNSIKPKNWRRKERRRKKTRRNTCIEWANHKTMDADDEVNQKSDGRKGNFNTHEVLGLDKYDFNVCTNTNSCVPPI